MTTPATTKEHPILFSGPMVKAILEDRKTQTRRVMKPQPVEVGKNQLTWKEGTGHGAGAPVQDAGWWFGCPYGNIGDCLWVRETWMCDEYGRRHQSQGMVRYRADAESFGAWRPSIFMPRWASRISLTITDVRVERVQNITEEDALAEGVQLDYAAEIGESYDNARDAFRRLWDSINASRGYGWDINPWVWVVSFKRG